MAVPQSATRRAPQTASWESLPLDGLRAQLGASDNGLTAAEAQVRLAKFAYNELPEEKTNPFLKFLSYFWGPIPWMIEVAAILSAVVRHWEDFVIILVFDFRGEGLVDGSWHRRKPPPVARLFQK